MLHEPSRCDLIGPIEDLKAENAALAQQVAELQTLLDQTPTYISMKNRVTALDAQVKAVEATLKKASVLLNTNDPASAQDLLNQARTAGG